MQSCILRPCPPTSCSLTPHHTTNHLCPQPQLSPRRTSNLINDWNTDCAVQGRSGFAWCLGALVPCPKPPPFSSAGCCGSSKWLAWWHAFRHREDFAHSARHNGCEANYRGLRASRWTVQATQSHQSSRLGASFCTPRERAIIRLGSWPR